MKTDAPYLLAGVVLAAGRSSRMGSDKALLTVDGQPLWRRQYELLGEAGVSAERYLSVRSDQTWAPPEINRVTDSVVDRGPLGGIAATMDACTCGHLAVLAVDIPRLPAVWFTYLREQLGSGVGTVGQHGDGLYEPLAAIYPRAMAYLIKEELEAERLSLQNVIKRAVAAGFLRVRLVEPAQTGWFENWNSPEAARPSSSLRQ